MVDVTDLSGHYHLRILVQNKHIYEICYRVSFPFNQASIFSCLWSHGRDMFQVKLSSCYNFKIKLVSIDYWLCVCVGKGGGAQNLIFCTVNQCLLERQETWELANSCFYNCYCKGGKKIYSYKKLLL